jgi:molybdenum ABC transporter molybdate-binding protein
MADGSTGLRRMICAAVIGVAMGSAANAQEPVRLYAAGSLTVALTDVNDAFARDSGLKVTGTFGASGLLRERIEKGETAEVFASANMDHPAALAQNGKAAPVVLFARNRLCAISKPELGVTAANVLEKMLDPAVKLGTSTPKADPSGDYAWAVFEKAEKLRAGSFKALDAKALQLVGGPNSVPPPPGRNSYAYLIDTGKADLFLGYCTNAMLVRKEIPTAQIIDLPDALTVGADYGLTILNGARPEATRLAMYILSPAGQAILARHGFSAPGLPGS